ncbi:dihydrodipicolinate synthase family protein [Kribbella speibonae]|uniref:Dihydrodipicolinate synthase family protein n=1 Tax=Kribbella speibonae TaxID=1572660 RepID=A0A4R0ITD4_9ACTN|nr:dihydrodipicolinate synthase family protein [Kribbella speibonae]TCC36367.1 dihydrodipicolinate synthase family protein [Kribbella speibonae]
MTTTVPLSGVLVALITPFSADGAEIDLTNLRAQVDRLIQAGVHGLVPGGSTGEFTALSLAERKMLTEGCVKAADGRVPVIAGTGALSTAEAVELSRHAAEVGAASLMVVPPFYDAPNVDEVKAHLAAVHKASGLPIVYYNIPSASGVKLTAAEIAGLAEVEGVAYLKDTSGDAVALSELLVAHADKITAFNGWDTLTFFGLASGAKGTVWGATNVIPELSMQLWDAVAVRCDLAEGRRLWEKIWPICNFLESYNYAAAVKTGLELIGHPAGPVRAPFNLLDDDARARFSALLADAGALPA